MRVRSLMLPALAATAFATVVAAQELDASRKQPSPLADAGSEPRIIVKLRSADTDASESKPANMLQSVASRSGFKTKGMAALGARLHVIEVASGAAGESIEATLVRLNADSAVQ